MKHQILMLTLFVVTSSFAIAKEPTPDVPLSAECEKIDADLDKLYDSYDVNCVEPKSSLIKKNSESNESTANKDPNVNCEQLEQLLEQKEMEFETTCKEKSEEGKDK